MRRKRVALVTESTYPCARGGVAVWCDQLIRNLPGVDFTLVAITPSTREPVVWDLPANVVDFRRHAAWDRIATRRRRAPSRLPGPVLELISILTEPPGGAGAGTLGTQVRAFRPVFDRIVELALSGELGTHLDFDSFLGPTMELIDSSTHLADRYERSLADGLAIATALPHLLGPLLIDPGEVDLVHASANGLPALVAMSTQARRGTPVMMAEHGLYLRERYLGAGRELTRPVVKDVLLRFYRLVTVLAYERCDRLAPASSFNGRWERALGAEGTAVSTLHNGVDPVAFPCRVTEVRSPDVVWLGRIDPVKDLHTLLRAADLVRREVPAVRFRLFGEEPSDVGGYLESCLALSDELDLGRVVSFEGRIGHPVSAFHRGRISVLSSITEGFPYSVLESMSCGVPVVGTEVGGVPEAIGGTGLVVPPRDPAAMASAVVRLLTDDDERLRLSRAARARVEDLYALDQMLEHHDTTYRDLTRVIDLRDRPSSGRRHGPGGGHGSRAGSAGADEPASFRVHDDRSGEVAAAARVAGG